MNKRELALLERAFDAEVTEALNGTGLFVIQTRSKLAEKLEREGLLRRQSIRMDVGLPFEVSGYALTELGRMTYCMEYADLSMPDSTFGEVESQPNAKQEG